MDVQEVQKEIIDNYFGALRQYGYLRQDKAAGVIFAILLLDTVGTFNEFVTGEFKWDINRIMHKLDCCNCSITWDKYNLSTPFYVIGQWGSQVAPHTHVISDIIGLQARLADIDAKIKKVDAKANAGL